MSTMKGNMKTQAITMRDNNLSRYFHDINRYKVLSAEEEARYAELWINNHDEKAKEMLINCNLRFVITVAKEYVVNGSAVTFNDLIMAGNEGLMCAVNKFDPTRGFRLCSYAVHWIKQHINRLLEKQDNFVRLPGNKRIIYNKLMKIAHLYEQEYYTAISVGKLAELADLETQEVQEILNSMSPTVSIDMPLKEDSDLSLADQMPSDYRADDLVNQEDLRNALMDALKILSERERNVLLLHSGYSGDGLTFEQIGEKMGMTRERCRQIFNNARHKIISNCPHLRSYVAA